MQAEGAVAAAAHTGESAVARRATGHRRRRPRRALPRSAARRNLREAPQRGDVHRLGAHDLSRPRLAERGEGTAQPARAPAAREARAHRDRPERSLVVGHHEAAHVREVRLPVPLRRHGYLQPLHRGLDARRQGERDARHAVHRRDHREVRRASGSAHAPRRPWRSDAQQAAHRAPGPARHGEELQQAAHVERQPVLGERVQNAQVPPDVPEEIPRRCRRARVLFAVLRLVQRPPPPQRHRAAHAGRRALWPRRRAAATSSRREARRVRRAS